jgi:hypothetical protein
MRLLLFNWRFGKFGRNCAKETKSLVLIQFGCDTDTFRIEALLRYGIWRQRYLTDKVVISEV